MIFETEQDALEFGFKEGAIFSQIDFYYDPAVDPITGQSYPGGAASTNYFMFYKGHYYQMVVTFDDYYVWGK